MRSFLRTCILAVGLSASFLCAQVAELPKPETQEPAKSPSPQPDLIPPDVLPPSERAASPAPTLPGLPTLPQLDEAFKQNPISQAAGQAKAHAEWRALNNQVANRPNVRAARQAAETAPTDLEKRVLLRRYYEILYNEMIALASGPELKTYLNDRKKDQLNALPQPRVRPTATPVSKKG